MPSMKATSVLGRSGIHWALMLRAMSSWMGLTQTNSHATVLRQLLPVGLFMTSEAVLAHLGVLGREATEQHHQLGVFSDNGPRGGGASDGLQGANHAGQDDAGGAEGVVGDVADAPTKAVEEAGKLPFGTMEGAQRCPNRRGRRRPRCRRCP